VINNIVRYYPIQIIEDGPGGMWVTGLPEHVDVITVGQQFVNNGEHVKTDVERNGTAT
jgi:multidrug efflux system membrane fusion protein